MDYAHRLPRIAHTMESMRLVPLPHDAPAVVAFVNEYRAKYKLGRRDLADEVGVLWEGILYQGRAVAVFGSRWMRPGHLDVTDAYCEDSRVGRTALALGCLAFRDQFRSGKIDMLTFTVLHENARFWKAAMRALDLPPYALIFVLRRT